MQCGLNIPGLACQLHSCILKCIIKFAMLFTMMVSNGGIITSLIMKILPFTPSISYSGMYRLSMVFLFEITVLTCTCFQVSPVSCNYSLIIVVTKWSMTWVPIFTGSLSPYLWSRMTKTNMSSLYWGKLGIVRLASTYPLYGIGTPCLLEMHQTSQWKDPQPKF